MFCCASDETGVVASKDKRIVFRLPPQQVTLIRPPVLAAGARDRDSRINRLCQNSLSGKY